MFKAIPFSLMWVGLAKAQKNPITPIKFALGILQLGLGFGFRYERAVYGCCR